MSSADTASTIELEDFFSAMAFWMPARMPVTVISSTVSGLRRGRFLGVRGAGGGQQQREAGGGSAHQSRSARHGIGRHLRLPPNRLPRLRRGDPSFVVKITANKCLLLQLEKWTKCHVWLFPCAA
jgi:hypothetical protein